MTRLWNLTLLLVALLGISTTTYAATDKLKVDTYEGPTKEGACEEGIQEGDYVQIHFTVSIDESSKTGEAGNTQKWGKCVGLHT